MDFVELIRNFISIFMHLDKHLGEIIRDYGTWTNLILFLIVFCETGLVVTPILPGDSLLFAAGAFAARGDLNMGLLLVLLYIAAIAGDATNYMAGWYLGPRMNPEGGRFVKKKYLDRTHRFYEKYGKMTIILARFVPIVRTFAPFLAGMGTMRYVEFAAYNIIGGICWVSLFLGGGYFFGNIEAVKNNFSLVIIGIILVSVLPIAIEYLRHRKAEAARAGNE